MPTTSPPKWSWASPRHSRTSTSTGPGSCCGCAGPLEPPACDPATPPQEPSRSAWTTDGVPIKPHGGHPDLLLADAVEQGIVTRFEAQLIGTTRLEDVSLTELADHLGIDYEVLRKRRRRAETRLAEAIADGRISAKIDG